MAESRSHSIVQGAAAAKRTTATGKVGYSALLSNRKVFAIAIFAS